MRRVVIGSTNPVKISCVKEGFEKCFPSSMKFEFVGFSAPSEVSDQPMSDFETKTGALNRTKNTKVANPEADYWVGIEGGLHKEEDNKQLMASAWIVIESKDNIVGMAKTGAFQIPPPVAKLVLEGMEMGHADDIIFKQKNSKQSSGAVGLLTGDVLTRASYYAHAVVLALIPFKHEELYASTKKNI